MLSGAQQAKSDFDGAVTIDNNLNEVVVTCIWCRVEAPVREATKPASSD